MTTGQQDRNLSPVAANNMVQIMICFGTRFLLLQIVFFLNFVNENATRSCKNGYYYIENKNKTTTLS